MARLQSQFNEAFTRLQERVEATGQADPSIAVAIAEHLRHARNVGIEAAAEGSARARASSDVAIIKAAVDDLGAQRTQADILNALVNRAASFAPRVAFFVVKNERATGWRARGLEGTVGDDSVREISLPLSVGHAARQGRAGALDVERRRPARTPKTTPSTVASATSRRSASSPSRSSRATRPSPCSTPTAPVRTPTPSTSKPSKRSCASRAWPSSCSPPSAPTAAAEPRAPPPHATAHAAPPPEPPSREPRARRAAAPNPSRAAEAPPRRPRPSPSRSRRRSKPQARRGRAAPADASARAAPPSEPSSRASPLFAPEARARRRAAPRRTPESFTPPPPPAPAAARAATPLASSAARRYGAMDMDFPVEVSDEDKRFHNEARRFARLLVSEIKLYNEQKVRDGRDAGDLYDRLREDIDRSRQMYDKRVRPEVAGRYDYFHHELVNTLAEGDPSKLGEGYPGASVNA